MWKLVVGFGSIIFFIAMIGLAIYYITQYTNEKNESTRKIEKSKSNDTLSNDTLSNDILSEIDNCINFLLMLPNQINTELMQGIILPLEKIKQIIERYPEKANNTYKMTEYIIPLTKKLADDYSFYHEHSNGENNSAKAMEACVEGLKGLSQILYKKADSMLEDQFYDVHAEVSALLQLHSINS